MSEILPHPHKLLHNFQFCPHTYCTVPLVYERIVNETRNHKTTEIHAFVYVMSQKSDTYGPPSAFQLHKAGLLGRIHG